AAPLFFAMEGLSDLHPSYHFSLKWFLSVYAETLKSCAKSSAVNERASVVERHFYGAVYKRACRSLFEEDRLAFSVMLT
ncbi:unnamed protein product, partial [Ostreobium quekettii]